MEQAPVSLHAHRLDHNASKLPTFRHADLHANQTDTSAAVAATNKYEDQEQHVATIIINKDHARNHSESAVLEHISKTVPSRKEKRRPVTSSGPVESTTSITTSTTIRSDNTASASPTSSHPFSPRTKARKDPARASRPPLAMLNGSQKLFQPTVLPEIKNNSTSTSAGAGAGAGNNNNPTEDWVANQLSSTTATSPLDDGKSQPLESPLSQPVTPSIPPIRGFRTSRKSVDAQSPRTTMDQDDTLRGLDGFNSRRPLLSRDQEEQSSDDSDLFLKLAREESAGNPRSGVIRRSQITANNRQSLPANHTVFQSSALRRRGSDQESTTGSRYGDDKMSQALTYRPSTREASTRERVPTALDLSRNRFQGGTSHSTPITPKASASREISPESQVSYGGRRPSVPDQMLPSPRTNSYRQSNLSYSTPRTYNSSPLVSRTTESVQEAPETHRATEGTESSVSTTAPSTVWDELEDLKSRINRLELTGKLPATSGAAISRASHDRPPTATTTVTTMSSSPKRGRGNSVSPVDSNGAEPQTNDAHPLLKAALVKSKTLLPPDVYSALESAAADALSIAAMVGFSGQSGPISSSQSTIGGASNLTSDRQVRRKADNMCRNLTELCLSLTEGRNEQVQSTQNLDRPRSRDTEIVQSVETQRKPAMTDLARVKSSPRALSRLEARRSSLLATSTLPSPRYAPSDAGTPTQSSMAGRRTSLLLRSRRGATEEPEEEDEARFRAPSRATTEIGRVRNSPREFVSHPPLPERAPPVQSSLPVRRHYASTSLTNAGSTALPAISNVSGRKYLDRATPERDTSGVVSRLAEDRAQRKSSIGQGFALGRTGSLTRRTRDTQGAGYQ